MGPADDTDAVRVAAPDEFPVLRRIEEEADGLYLEVGIGPFTQSADEDHLGQAAVVLVSGSPPVGFACVEIVDGLPHIWQLSVQPKAARRGRGRALIDAVCEWAAAQGYSAVTLTTFRDVPWNAPFYARMGFRPLATLSPGLSAIRRHEVEIGDDDFGARIAMRKDIPYPSGNG